MAAFHPTFDALPREIAIFPLPGALLLPQGRLPLNIFEPRYLAMIEDSLASGRMLGIVQPEPGGLPGETSSPVYRIGCLGRVSSFAETDDGRLLITLAGVIRYRIAEELEMRRGYRRVRPDFTGFSDDLKLVDRPVATDRAALLAALPPFFRARGIEANWDAIERTTDQMLVLTLAMVCPFATQEKQALLEAPTPGARAEMLVALLQMGAHDPQDGDQPGDRRPS